MSSGTRTNLNSQAVLLASQLSRALHPALLRYAGVDYGLASVQMLQLKNPTPSASNPAVFMAHILKDGDDFFSRRHASNPWLPWCQDPGLTPSDLRLATICNMVVGNCGDIINELSRNCRMKRWDPFDLTEFEHFISVGL